MRVLVDTSAVVALVLRNDRNHAAAVEALRRLTEAGAALVLTNFLVAETYSLLAARAYPAKAREWFLARARGASRSGPPPAARCPAKSSPRFPAAHRRWLTSWRPRWGGEPRRVKGQPRAGLPTTGWRWGARPSPPATTGASWASHGGRHHVQMPGLPLRRGLRPRRLRRRGPRAATYSGNW